MNCRNCNAEIPAGHEFCPACGQEAIKTAVEEQSFSSAFSSAGDLLDSSPEGTTHTQKREQVMQGASTVRFSSSFKRGESVLGEESRKTNVGHTTYNTSVVPQKAKTATKKFCPHCGRTLSETAKFCTGCGKAPDDPVTIPPVPIPPVPARDAKRKKRLIALIASISAVVIIAVVLAVVLTINLSGLHGPATQVFTALKNTVESDNFTVDFDIDGATGTAYVSIDTQKREVLLFAEASYDGNQATILICDGYCYRVNRKSYDKSNIQSGLDTFFDYYADFQDGDISWEDYIEGYYAGPENDTVFEKMDDCFSAYLKKLNDESWLSEYAGFSQKEEDSVTMYCFNPDAYAFLEASLNIFADVLTKDSTYYVYLDELKANKASYDRTDISLTFGVKASKLQHFELRTSGPQSWNKTYVKLDFYDFGKSEYSKNDLKNMFTAAIQNMYFQ